MAIFVSDNKQLDGVSSSSGGGATIIAQGTRIKGKSTQIADCILMANLREIFTLKTP